jgi:hypothetical protein
MQISDGFIILDEYVVVMMRLGTRESRGSQTTHNGIP